MLVGWGGNNGSTVTAAVIANQKKMNWHTKEGVQVGVHGLTLRPYPNCHGRVVKSIEFKF